MILLFSTSFWPLGCHSIVFPDLNSPIRFIYFCLFKSHWVRPIHHANLFFSFLTSSHQTGFPFLPSLRPPLLAQHLPVRQPTCSDKPTTFLTHSPTDCFHYSLSLSQRTLSKPAPPPIRRSELTTTVSLPITSTGVFSTENHHRTQTHKSIKIHHVRCILILRFHYVASLLNYKKKKLTTKIMKSTFLSLCA